MQKWLEHWNEDEALWRRYEELRVDFRLFASDSLYLDEEIDDWAWSESGQSARSAGLRRLRGGHGW